MHISDFDYELPPELIASEPARPRDASRMMVVDRRTGRLIDSIFRNLPEFLKPSDLLVLNNTRVFRARIHGKLERAAGTSRQVEVLFAARVRERVWEVMCKPGKAVRPGDRIAFGASGLEGVFGEACGYGLRLLDLGQEKAHRIEIEDFLEKYGRIPLPPYIDREDTPADAYEYQTIYASETGAVAAPTAGLHFTQSVFGALEDLGVETQQITLHVGVGTFVPVRTEDPGEHVLKPERYELTPETAARLNAAREARRRIVAAGTTTTRTLEHVVRQSGRFEAGKGVADLFILPGYEFKAVNAMLTNFHLPRSTLLMLVSAFASRDIIQNAYCHAVAERYRFYSYGDCMLIL